MIGPNIKNIREKKKMTQEALAETMGVSRQAVCMWETGKRELRVTTLNKLAKAFNVSVQNIMGGGGMVVMKKADKAVTFSLMAPLAKKVSVSGDFNCWDKNGTPMKKDRTGLWSTSLSMKNGKYQYKFIVDGQWRTDPSNKITARNPYGSDNSVKEVV